jgi:hypothetical protein
MRMRPPLGGSGRRWSGRGSLPRYRRRLLVGAAIAVIAAAAAILATYSPSFLPPGLHARDNEFAAATAKVLVDTRPSTLLDPSLSTGQTGQQTVTYALYLETDPVKAAIGRALGLGNKEIEASGPFTLLLGRSGTPAPASTLTPIAVPVDGRYRLVVDVDGVNPVLTLYSQAPSTAAAMKIVEQARSILIQHVAAQERSYQVASTYTPVIFPLGGAQGGMVDPTGRLQLMVLVFGLVALAGWIAVSARAARGRRKLRAAVRASAPTDVLGPDEVASDDWPHTKRVLPWAAAGFLVMVFTVPFDQIALPLPSILSPPDRLFLVAMVALWGASLAIVQGSARPSTKLTAVHLAAGIFFALCCASVALGGHALANLTEISPTVKKLALLASFFSFLFVVASVIRPGEVPRYAALIVGLAVVTSIAAIVEFRMHYNVFYNLWSKVLPVSLPPDFGVRDNIGRLTVVGPTAEPLELATLIAMAFPFALIGLINARDRRPRILYALAAAILIAGGLATERKTAVVAPLVGFSVLLFYRPRPILRGLKLAALPMAVLIHFSAPGAIGSTVHWLLPGTFGSVNTTSDRVARYDAIRPDVMSHLLIGRGFQSYDPLKYRILDNEFLDLLIGVGVIGLLAYVAIYWVILRSAHRIARSDDPRRASLGMACAASVATTLVANALFDTLAFPHVPYLLFFIAAMVVALQSGAQRQTILTSLASGRARRAFATALALARHRAPVARAPGKARQWSGRATAGRGSDLAGTGTARQSQSQRQTTMTPFVGNATRRGFANALAHARQRRAAVNGIADNTTTASDPAVRVDNRSGPIWDRIRAASHGEERWESTEPTHADSLE